MTARDGKPCRKCGANEWYADGACAPCKREQNRQWIKDNPEKHAENVRLWAKANPEKEAERNRRRRQANPARGIAEGHRRRTRKTAAGGSFTAAEWKDLCNHYGNRCLCCGREGVKLTADHIVPVSKGGSSNIDNIQPLCFSCNAKKHAKEIDYRPGTGLGRWIQRKIFG